MSTKKKSAPSGKAKAKGSTKPPQLEKLGTQKLSKRLKTLYALEKDVENKQARFDMASRDRLSAKGALQQAQEDLQKELREQREGPGELYAGVEGSVGDDDVKPAKAKAADSGSKKKGPHPIAVEATEAAEAAR